MLAIWAGLAPLAYLAAHLQSQRLLTHRHPVSTATLAVPTDADSILEGRRLVIVGN